VLRRSSEQRHRDNCIHRSPARHSEQFGARIETHHTSHCPAIERQVQPRPDADLKNQPLRPLDRPLAIRVEYPVPHSEVEQTRHNPAFVNAHDDLPAISFRSTGKGTHIDLHQGR
jgi:hypothetical protein